MRYAIVSETYPPEVNGVALTVESLECGLRARGHAVEVIRPRRQRGDHAAPHELLTAGAGIPRYPGMRFGLPAGRPLRARWATQRPDAVYIATEGPLGWSALRAAKALDIPVTTGFHTRFDMYMRNYGVGALEPMALRWMRHFHGRGNATLVPTCELADFLRSQRFANVVHLPRAVDTERFDPAHRAAGLRLQWGLAPDALAVLHLGRVAAEKNLPLAVRAFRALQQARPDARFVWVGDGPELAALREAHPDFVFCGTQLGAALAAHVASCDLFLFPSHSETFGNVTLEAMASGVPTVAFRYGAAREHLLDGVHGAAIENADEDAFVAAASRIGTASQFLRDAMGDQARHAVRKLQPAQVAADLDDILQRLIHQQAWRHAHAAMA
ncbi:MAG TPA: glycosyltransferase family 1 protein [Luteimonas sp.]|nr:glycosyltransferase family 1 protein [Luteimonas sp.]